MYIFICWGFIAIMLMCFSSCDANGLDQQLRRYDIISSPIHVRHKIVRRSVGSENYDVRQLDIKALNRQFRLILQPDQHVLHSNFAAYSVDAHGRHRPIHVNARDFYIGHLSEPGISKATATFFADDSMMATIETANETYYVEPLWRLDNSLPRRNGSMVVYRLSDVREETHGAQALRSHCGYVLPNGSDTSVHHSKLYANGPPYDASLRSGHSRVKRDTSVKNRCRLKLVADYRLRQIFDSRASLTNYMITMVERVNKIFFDTDFNGYTGYGFEVHALYIHEAFSADPRSYNAERIKGNMDVWDTRKLLDTFSLGDFGGVCLAHLMTYQGFSNGVLGLAYIANPNRNVVGGVCTRPYYVGRGKSWYNSAWTTSMDRKGNALITHSYMLVMAHELGHNWGSEHDAGGKECIPGGQRGNYIMYPYAVTGYNPNNNVFSTCSKRQISNVIKDKSGQCFEPSTKARCGNGMLEEPEEECDAGTIGQDGNATCCDKMCKLRPNKQCDPGNNRCCTEQCQFSPEGTVCQRESVLYPCMARRECAKASDGRIACTRQVNRADESPCGNHGKCRSGDCVSFCQQRLGVGATQCACLQLDESCRICCRHTASANCSTYPDWESAGQKKNLTDGVSCVVGSCEKGVCRKEIRNTIRRIWDIIKSMSVDAAIRFFKANMVGTVLVFSLVLWIPACCIISWRDRQWAKQVRKKTRAPRTPADIYAQQSTVLIRPPLESIPLAEPSTSIG